MSTWFYADGEEKFGPLSEEQVMEKLKAGELTSVTPVWSEGMESWLALGQVPELSQPGTTQSQSEPVIVTEEPSSTRENPVSEIPLLPQTPAPAKKGSSFPFVGLFVLLGLGLGLFYLLSSLGLFGRKSTSDKTPVGQNSGASNLVRDVATTELIDALKQANPKIKIEDIPGKVDDFKLTNRDSGEEIVLDMAAIKQIVLSGDSDALDKLFKKTASPSTNPDPVPGPETAHSPVNTVQPGESSLSTQPLPDWIPQPSDGRTTVHEVSEKEGVINGSFLLSSAQPLDQSADFFQQKLEASDYVVQRQLKVENGGTTILLNAKSEETPPRVLQLTIKTQDSVTQIAGTYTVYK